ncbi:LURP-one-related/scramblase family protein [Thermobifida cellulosilytica]|jgi:Uncharacterized conserved protein|uniref:Scramblase n=1 Tax=Thermobifida cellulosilytica TB100 TaxID=665004 RepID=A0A147KIC1_THECS|nr:hypothetical protein [Thermobifida cellulosilytica]KUP97042.1 hypothetical protein AC529_08940 [Thermobifida cellulosilytica TB100]
MDFQQLQSLPRMIMRQRIRPMVNQYEFHAVLPDGSEGELLAFAQQKRLALKEQVTLYTDDTKQYPVLGFKARNVIDLGATYDVFDASGTPIGLFRKDFKQSLLRSTWHLEQPNLGQITGQERDVALAVLRRFIEALAFVPYHFDFVLNGQVMFSIDKKWGIRDRYTIEIPSPHVDRRLVIAMAVAVDALQGR